MDNRFHIPPVSRDERMGSVFNTLFKIINWCEGKDSIILDFKDRTFFHPFFIAPLSIYCDITSCTISHINVVGNLKSYMDAIAFDDPKIIECSSDVDRIIERYSNKSYIPVCKFVTNTEDRDQIESKIQALIECQSKADSRMRMPLSYLLSELITNIVEHSHSDYGYIYSQYLAAEGCVDICIADKGISIFGSYIQADKFTSEIQDNPAKALQLAIEGRSTKDLPNTENRGYGISSSIKMLVEGLNGSFFILSGGAFYRHDKTGATIVKLPESIEWSGTIILLRIPIDNIPTDFDCYKYIG